MHQPVSIYAFWRTEMETIPQTKNTFEVLSDDLRQVVAEINRSVVAVNARRHLSSSGVHWRDGIIITAAHTIRRTDDIVVILPNGQTVAASFAGADTTIDLAVLMINREKLSTPHFGDSAQLQNRTSRSCRRARRAAGPKCDARHGRRVEWRMAHLARRIDRPIHRLRSRSSSRGCRRTARRCACSRAGH